MPHDNAEAGLPTPSVTVGGGTYRATASGDGDTWRCPHVHFTHQSARTCADRYVTKLAKARRVQREPVS